MASNFNKVRLAGHLTQDPACRTPARGLAVPPCGEARAAGADTVRVVCYGPTAWAQRGTGVAAGDTAPATRPWLDSEVEALEAEEAAGWAAYQAALAADDLEGDDV